VGAILGGPVASRDTDCRIFGRPLYWQGEDERLDDDDPQERRHLLFQDEFGEGHIHVWIHDADAQKRDYSRCWMDYREHSPASGPSGRDVVIANVDPRDRHASRLHLTDPTGGDVIARLWRGWVATAKSDEYADYIGRTGLAEYRETPGNLGAQMWTRDLGDGRTEVLTLSWWESADHVRGFAGDDIDQAVFYPEDDRYLIDRETTVRHYRVASADPPGEQLST
jgi:heme-degrading monooxygenase HmoA